MQMKCHSSRIWRYLHNENLRRFQMLPKHIGFHCHNGMHSPHPRNTSLNTLCFQFIQVVSLGQTPSSRKAPFFSVQWISTDKGNYFTFCQLECFQSQCCTLVGASLKNRRKNFENLKNLNFEKTLKTTVALWRISQKLMQNESKFLFNNNHR